MEERSRKFRIICREARPPFQPLFSILHIGLLLLLAVGLAFLSYGKKPISISYDSTKAEDGITKADNQVEFRIVSMNIALLEASRVAPADWTNKDQTDALLKSLLESDPHVIALQECPSAGWIYKSFPAYRVIGEKRSHSGFTTLLVKNGTFTTMERGSLPGSDYAVYSVGIPAVLGISAKFAVASTHLAPFEEGALKRRDQLSEIVNATRTKGIPLIIAGDMNMRDSEDAFVEQSMGLTDAWKANGSKTGVELTWDTTKHDSGIFNEFYGKSTRQVQRRYDRIYVHGANNVVVRSFHLLANTPIGESQNHFLSDHFGLAATLALD